MGESKQVGKWGPTFDTPRVAVHATLLPNSQILCWGRRKEPKKSSNFNELDTWPFFINFSAFPANEENVKTPEAERQDVLKNNNLFYSGHCLQPDGNLLVVGGHISDGQGRIRRVSTTTKRIAGLLGHQ
jgi:galactose oxidase